MSYLALIIAALFTIKFLEFMDHDYKLRTLLWERTFLRVNQKLSKIVWIMLLMGLQVITQAVMENHIASKIIIRGTFGIVFSIFIFLRPIESVERK